MSRVVAGIISVPDDCKSCPEGGYCPGQQSCECHSKVISALREVVYEAASHLYDRQDMARVREMAKQAIADIDKKRAGR